MHVCMYVVCVPTCMYVCMYVLCVPTCMHVCMYVVCVPTCVHVYVYGVHTHVCACLYYVVCVPTCMHVYVVCVLVCRHVYVCGVCTHVYACLVCMLWGSHLYLLKLECKQTGIATQHYVSSGEFSGLLAVRQRLHLGKAIFEAERKSRGLDGLRNIERMDS